MAKRSIIAALFAAAVAWMGAWIPAAQAAGAPTCPAAIGQYQLEPGSQVTSNPDGLHALNCRYEDANGMELAEDALWTVAADPGLNIQHPGFCNMEQFSDTLNSTTNSASVNYQSAIVDDSDHAQARRVAYELMAQIEPLGLSCSPSAAASPAPGSTATPPLTEKDDNNFAPIVGLSTGAVGLATTVLVRKGIRKRRGDGPGPAPTTSAIYDGNDATTLLVEQGWLEPVARPDGSTGWRPLGDLTRFLNFDHGPWQPPFAPGTIGPDGNALHQLTGVAMTPAADGTLDSVTVVTSVGPPTPVPPIAAPSAPVDVAVASPMAPAAAPSTPALGSDPGSQMLLDLSGNFLDWDTDDCEGMAVPLALRAMALEAIEEVLASVPAPLIIPAPPAPPAIPAPTGPFAALLGPSGGSLTIGAADLAQLAPDRIAADGTIREGVYEGKKPTFAIGDTTINVNLSPYRGSVELHARGGRIVVDPPDVEGPMAEFMVDPVKVQTIAQGYLDASFNGPINARGLHVAGVQLTPDGVRITTTPVTK
jgi:hypothetical protein